MKSNSPHGLCRQIFFIIALAPFIGPSTTHASLTHPTNTLEAGIRNAIMRGDAQELRTLLSHAGDLSSSDAAIARRALASIERIGAEDAQLVAKRYGLDWANKVEHALRTTRDGAVKRALFERYKTAEAIFVRLQKALDSLRDLPDGNYAQLLTVDGLDVTLRIYVESGIARISTILKW